MRLLIAIGRLLRTEDSLIAAGLLTVAEIMMILDASVTAIA